MDILRRASRLLLALGLACEPVHGALMKAETASVARLSISPGLKEVVARQMSLFLSRPPEAGLAELRSLAALPNLPALAADRQAARLILEAFNGKPPTKLKGRDRAAVEAAARQFDAIAGSRPTVRLELERIAGELERGDEREIPPALERLFSGGTSLIQMGGTIAMTEVQGKRGDPGTGWARRAGAALRQNEGLFDGGRDSSQLLLADLTQAIQAARRHLDRGYAPVITQGTDSLDTTGLILSQLFADRLIVLTAAFHPFTSPGSDGPANYNDALLVSALSGRAGVPQVPYVVINGAVYLAASLAKLDIDYRDGRRGFKSYAGQVGRVEGGRVVWDPAFLKRFETGRKGALAKTQKLREEILDSIDKGTFRFADVEIVYVNSFTPRRHIQAALRRLERGESQAAVFHGVFPRSAPLRRKIAALRAEGKTVLVQDFDGPALGDAAFPRGIEPIQLLYKTSLFLNHARGREFRRVLAGNIAGEVAPAPVAPSMALDIERGDFYTAPHAARGFVLYQQNFRLMKAILIDEILRLRDEAARGRGAELIIEGLGNGHIFIGRDAGAGRSKRTLRGLKGRLEAAETLLDILATARQAGIKVTITTRVKDAVPNADYEVGRRLAESDVGARLSPLPGREYLRALARP